MQQAVFAHDIKEVTDLSNITEFVKKHDYLICVDSDGCAMDTMDIKHFNCFGPCMVTEWGLEQWKDEILDRWNVINLFSMTRGINRFKGLAMALGEIKDLKELRQVVRNSEAVETYQPNHTKAWEDAYQRMLNL